MGERGGRPRIVLAEAPLETIPREIWGHPSVYKYARKRGKPPHRLLLDSSVHHQAMRGLRDRERRGRPDIVHLTLLCGLESPAVTEGLIEVTLHTYGDYVIWARPGTRLPRSYTRFTGLMEQLFEHGSVPPGSSEPLLTIRPGAVEKLAGSKALLLDPEAPPRKLEELVAWLLSGGALVLPLTPRSTPSPRLRAAFPDAASAAGMRGAEPWVLLSHILAQAAARAGLV